MNHIRFYILLPLFPGDWDISECLHFLLRFMAIEDEKKLKLSRRAASVWVSISMALVVVIGIAGRALSGKRYS